MSTGLGGEIKAGLARHDDMHFAIHVCHREFVGRIDGRLGGEERPGAGTGICGPGLKESKQCEQRKFKN